MTGDFADKQIGFIGGGNMAQAIIRGLLHAGHPADAISVADPSPEQQSAVLEIASGLVVSADNALVAAASDLLVLAVKPQIMAEVAGQLGHAERPDNQVIASVAAGITLASMRGWFGADAALVRVMPNQPSLVGCGMSGLCATPATSEADKALLGYAMGATGLAIWVDNEDLMDTVTAVSGSGPAYFYLIMEIMQEIAGEFGFDTEVARMLAIQTALGAAEVAASSDEDLHTLRERVTSPGGTTAAALESLESDNIRAMFRKALTAAHARSVELGKN